MVAFHISINRFDQSWFNVLAQALAEGDIATTSALGQGQFIDKTAAIVLITLGGGLERAAVSQGEHGIWNEGRAGEVVATRKARFGNEPDVALDVRDSGGGEHRNDGEDGRGLHFQRLQWNSWGV